MEYREGTSELKTYIDKIISKSKKLGRLLEHEEEYVYQIEKLKKEIVKLKNHCANIYNKYN